MRLVKEYPDQSAMTVLGFTKALILLSIPIDDRDEFISGVYEVNGDIKEVADMTTRELETIVKQCLKSPKTEPIPDSDESENEDVSPLTPIRTALVPFSTYGSNEFECEYDRGR